MSSSRVRNSAVRDRAQQVTAQHRQERRSRLSVHLNSIGVTTTRGTPYVVGGRGMAWVCRCAYHYYDQHGDAASAQMIAKAFTDEDGKYPYNK